MSVRVIFKPEIYEHCESFPKRDHMDAQFHGVSISTEGSMICAFLALEIENAEVNPLITDKFIDGYSARVFVRTSFAREEGVYVYGTAEGVITDCDVNTPDGGRNPGYWLAIRSTTLRDMKDLNRLIRAGTITPKTSYEASQALPERNG